MVAGIVLGVLVVVSYLAAWWLTDVSPNWAFYSLPTRAWELGLGGLLAATAVRHESLPSWIAVPVGWLGLGAILAALEKLDFEMIGELGHKMCGSGSGYGFPRITELGDSIQQAAKERNSAAIRSQVAELSGYLQQVEVI